MEIRQILIGLRCGTTIDSSKGDLYEDPPRRMTQLTQKATEARKPENIKNEDVDAIGFVGTTRDTSMEVDNITMDLSQSFLSRHKKYLADTNLHVHLEEIKVDKTLRFVEEPVEIIEREVKSLKRSRIPIVKSIGTRSEVMRIS
ncbi:hypothetical protein Tco_0273583 [Tanacetum coccineum]